MDMISSPNLKVYITQLMEAYDNARVHSLSHGDIERAADGDCELPELVRMAHILAWPYTRTPLEQA
jgi:hypothetical protein